VKEPIADREWPVMHAVWRLGLVSAKKVHTYLLGQGHVLDRRKVALFLQSLTEKGYLRSAKIGRMWTFVALVEPSEAFAALWSQVREVALDGDPEHVKEFLRIARER